MARGLILDRSLCGINLPLRFLCYSRTYWGCKKSIVRK
jgi:hypothetical protein